ncbi:MAG: hypothetical protein QOJ76_3178 [Acidobacteriota bacterium]|jgi:Flp pilus assembly protein TadD|nr:hypothetical protein [Acidobacteriota bacterium]
MTSYAQRIFLSSVILLSGICTPIVSVSAQGGGELRLAASALPRGQFAPSNAQTEDGRLIPAEQFFPAARCASCHQDTHAAWSESLHRNAGREPFYTESVDLLRQTRGNEATQHCEACHAPVALLSGALRSGSNAPPRALVEEGVTCTVCHSITTTSLEGTGSYTIRRPALLARADGTPVAGDVSDKEIMADLAGHRRAVMRPLLREPEFCAACHKSVAPPALNGYKMLRGFSVYDEWQQSGASREAALPFYRRETRASCNSCHMQAEESAHDMAAKEGVLASHRWLGANTATPLFYGARKQVERTTEFLRDKVLNVDIFSLTRAATGEVFAPLDAKADNHLTLRAGEEVSVEVVVANRKAAHSFPPELRDMYEPWVEFEALDAAGRTIFHSGFIKPDQTLDESAHVYKALLLDESGRVVTRHQMWATRVKAYDNAVASGRTDIARYRFRVPGGAAGALTLRARVNYRRFIQEYTDYVLQKHNAAQLKMPVVCMAEAGVKIVGGATQPRKGEGQAREGDEPRDAVAAENLWRRWNDYGIGLMEQAQYGAASRAFARASELKPNDPDPLISAAVAEMKTERFGPERAQLFKARELLERALKLAPTLARARFFYALLLRSEGQPVEAADELARIAREFPRDREVVRQLGQTLYGLGRLESARAAFESLLTIDPNDTGAYQFLAPLYKSEGRTEEAARADALFLLWRDDPLADRLAARFFALNPQWAEERVWSHTHGSDSPPRPTLTGHFAAP